MFWFKMGSQASTMKKALIRERNLRMAIRGSRKARTGILSFEVANVMTKIVQLWQSLSDTEILQLRTGAIKAEGVRNLVSDNDAVLLSLACMEKLQDLTAVAWSVARFGKRCQDPLLQGFEHVYNDVLKHKVDMRTWEFSPQGMEAKVKKMQQIIAATSSVYEELEILGNLEKELRRLLDQNESAGVGPPDRVSRLSDMEEKARFHRQELKYLRDMSLWNCTWDKTVSLLAQTVYTIHGRIKFVFGSPLLGLPQLLPVERLRDTQSVSRQTIGDRRRSLKQGRASGLRRSLECQLPSSVPAHGPVPGAGGACNRTVHTVSSIADLNKVAVNGATNSSTYVTGSRASLMASDKRPDRILRFEPDQSRNPYNCNLSPYRACLYPVNVRTSQDFQPLVTDSPPGNPAGFISSTKAPLVRGAGRSTPRPSFAETSLPSSARRLRSFEPKWSSHRALRRVRRVSPGNDLFNQNSYTTKVFFDPRSRHHNAPSTTLGGAALALHYSNIVIIVDKMIKFPHFIRQESRDNLYRMLPKSVQMAVRARLRRAEMRKGAHGRFDAGVCRGWKHALEGILAWLTPLAHNMSRWQSEHNFEQQQVLQRSNVLLFQTLHFADLAKTEAAITELLVGLNYIYGYEKERNLTAMVECGGYDDSQDELEDDDSPEWDY